MKLLWKVINIFMCADAYIFIHIHIHSHTFIYIYIYILVEEGKEGEDKPNHVTTDSLCSASGLLKLNSLIRHSE